MTQAPRKELDALDLLMQDHREIESLFSEFEYVQQDDEAAARVIDSACAELRIHDRLANEIFYAAVDEAGGGEEIDDLLVDAEDAHDLVLELIENLEQADTDAAARNAQFTVISSHVKQHILETETELFPRVKALENLDLEALAVDMMELRRELMAETGVAEEGAQAV